MKRWLLWAVFAWMLAWFVVDRHRRGLLRVYFAVVPGMLAEQPTVAATAIDRMVFYKHVYSYVQACERSRAAASARQSTPKRSLLAREPTRRPGVAVVMSLSPGRVG